MNYTMNHITEQVFFFLFAIHLPPVEDGEFLLYIMLNYAFLHENLKDCLREKTQLYLL